MVDFEYQDMTYYSIGKIYGISIEEERTIWKICYINKIIYIPSNCPKYNLGKVNLVNFNSVLNLLKGSCNKANCLNRFDLRKFPIFAIFPKILIQILMSILKAMIVDKKNGIEIRKIIKNKYNNVNINIKTIFEFMNYIRKETIYYLSHLYETEAISTFNGSESYSIDETLMSHNEGSQIWVVGVIKNSNLNKVRLNLTTTRNSTYLKYFVERYIKRSNKIVSNFCAGYAFLNQSNSGYSHLTFNHYQGQFGEGINSSSHMESFWAFLKNNIKKIYHCIPSKNLLYFVKEGELRYILREKSDFETLSYMETKFKYCYDGCNFDLYSEEILLNNP